MKNCSFKWLLSTIALIIATTFLTPVIPASASPTPTTSQEVKMQTDLPVATTDNNYQHAVKEKENGTIINSGNFAETPAILKMPQIYAKKISYASGNTTMTGNNYRGKQPFNRMM